MRRIKYLLRILRFHQEHLSFRSGEGGGEGDDVPDLEGVRDPGGGGYRDTICMHARHMREYAYHDDGREEDENLCPI